MCMIYDAESCAFETRVLRNAFTDVGMSPCNFERILDVGQNYCLSLSLENESDRVQEIMEKYIILEDVKTPELDKMIPEMEPAVVKTAKKVKRPRGRPKKVAPAPQKQVPKRPRSSNNKTMDESAPKPRKRQRKI